MASPPKYAPELDRDFSNTFALVLLTFKLIYHIYRLV